MEAIHKEIRELMRLVINAEMRLEEMNPPSRIIHNLDYTLEWMEKYLVRANEQLGHIRRECDKKLEAVRKDWEEKIQSVRDAERRKKEMQRNIRDRIQDLCRQVPNGYQVDNIWKVLSTSSSYERSYLTGYTRETNPKNKTILGTFTVKGSFNPAKNERQVYGIKFYKHGENPKGTFWCNCPDHKFNATKKDIVCKHIVFLVTRVGKILDPAFFNTKHLTPEQHAQMLALGERLADEGLANENDATTAEVLGIASDSAARDDRFEKITKMPEPEDPCPICYEEFGADPAAGSLLSCPACQNCFHKDCMEVWLNRGAHCSCAMCRSRVWAAYC